MFSKGGMFMICSICGKEIPDSAKFCAKCGTPTQETNAPAQEAPAVTHAVTPAETFIPMV